MKHKKSNKKYAIESQLNDSISNQNYIADIKQQLREAFEQLEQYKLSSELEGQKRLLADQQWQKLKQENKELRCEVENLRKELTKYTKKYSKVKEMRSNCEKCKVNEDFKEKAERQRQVFLKQRTILKSQINQLKKMIEKIPQETEDFKAIGNIEHLRKEIGYKDKTIEDQKKIIRYLDEKLSAFQIQKLQTLSYVESIDQKLQELQMQNLILRGIGPREHSTPSRKNGSIKNLEKVEKLEKSRSRYEKNSYTNY